MMTTAIRTDRLNARFVERFPAQLESGTLYISIEFATTAHLCCCGCGNRAVNPLSSTDWKLIFDGETVSLSPSVGNWSFECESHYWIDENNVIWAPKWSKERIALGRAKDRALKEGHYSSTEEPPFASRDQEEVQRPSWWRAALRLKHPGRQP